MNELAKKIHENAVVKGFWDEPRETGTLLMLCVSELSEAMEADRKGRKLNKDEFTKSLAVRGEENFSNVFESWVKDTFEDELADTVIRILDLCGRRNIDIDWHIEQKMKYNATREKMHGKRY